jgi:diguanylate cyclase (GGDEF)-like protein
LARLIFYFSSALTLAYTGWILFFPFLPATESAVSSVLIVLFLFLTLLLARTILRLPGFPVELRRSWWLIGFAAFSQIIAEAIWFYNQTILKIDPFPSLADIFYLFYYLALFAAVLSLPFAPPRRQERALMVMDITIVMVVAILFMYYFVLTPLLQNLDSLETFELFVSFLYPCADLLVLAGLFSFLQRDVERVSREIILFLCASMLLTLLADAGWMALDNFLDLYTETAFNWLWTLSALCMLMAACWQASRPIPQPANASIRFRPLLRDVALYFATGAAFLLMLVSTIEAKIADPRAFTVILTGVALGALVMLRQYVLLVENRRLYREMERLATIDQLTGLNNRRSFDHAIETEARRAERFNHPYAVLMMDVDNFKLYNARFGHLGGDVMLKRVAELLLMNLRTTDFVARFGGDEFVAILPETERANAQRVAEKIMNEAKDHFIQESIGISVGVAVWQPGLSYLEVIDAADQQLYKNKPVRALS